MRLGLPHGEVTHSSPIAIVGGVVCGTWSRKGDQLTVAWLDERRRPDAAIEQEAARLSNLVDRDLHLNLTS